MKTASCNSSSTNVQMPCEPNTPLKQPIQIDLCGLINIGNTCFMNSALQCLVHIPPLNEWAISDKSFDSRHRVTRAYSTLIEAMRSKVNIPSALRNIKKCIGEYAPIFSDYNQKDSHEFINSLLNALHDELEKNDESKGQTSIITELFRIHTESRVTCLKCKTCDTTEEITYCLSLPVDIAQDSLALVNLLDEFSREEQLDGEYYCSTCDELQCAKQKSSICSPLPPVIIVQLKRFTFNETFDKCNVFVDYPLTDWQVLENDSSRYDLSSVSLHVGNLKSGHYTTIARRNEDDQWHHFNDGSFEPIKNKNLLVNRNAYVLVYLKKA
jgi:ubiquitin C-terminal hydrolase